MAPGSSVKQPTHFPLLVGKKLGLAKETEWLLRRES